MTINKMFLGVSEFKALDDGSMSFSCYGNTKGNVDHAWDRVIDGAYQASIAENEQKGTMPKMFWMHDAYSTPVGVWSAMREDEKGLFLEGRLANTDKGREIYELMKMGAIDSFSIGYSVVKEKWNDEMRCNDLIEIKIREVSAVTFACNEESRLVELKSKLEINEYPTKRELERFLNECGLSRKQATAIASRYDDSVKQDDIFELMAKVS